MVLQWIRFRVLEAALAVALVAGGQSLIDNVQDRRKAAVSADTWYSVNKIYVPDHTSNDDPIITFDRAIKVKFRGFWVMEVQREQGDGAFRLECSGSGINDYEPNDIITDNQVRWSWFIGGKCQDLRPGRYRVRASWIMHRSDWPEKQLTVYSNVFQVQS